MLRIEGVNRVLNQIPALITQGINGMGKIIHLNPPIELSRALVVLAEGIAGGFLGWQISHFARETLKLSPSMGLAGVAALGLSGYALNITLQLVDGRDIFNVLAPVALGFAVESIINRSHHQTGR